MADRDHIEHIGEQAALYALGALPAEEAKQFAQRLAAECPLCRAELQGCERALATLAMSVPETAPPPRARERLLGALTPRASAEKATLSAGTLIRADEKPWVPSPFPGVEFRHLYERKTFLVRMAPDTSLPAHEHGEAEQCLVLEGSITSEGVTARAGDFLYMPAGSSHSALYSQEGCTFLIAYA